MIEVNGSFADAIVFNDLVEDGAIKQITGLCNNEASKGSKIRVMSDIHEGNGCTIGTTMTIHDRVTPNLVGVDIGCGMLCVKLEDSEIDFRLLDAVIHKNIPSGFNSRETIYTHHGDIDLNNLHCVAHMNKLDRAYYQLGTLGGGNHFIEIDKGSDGSYYLVIHSGSRNIGKQVAEHYQKLAINSMYSYRENYRKMIIDELTSSGRSRLIGERLGVLPHIIDDLAYLTGKDMENYLDDMNLCQWYADINRKIIAEIIINEMKFTSGGMFTTIHNYIDCENMILRKGAISAQKDEMVIIPMNMRDGSIIAIGKGNSDWNFSAPHGAGRIMGRREAKRTFKLEDFQESMKGIYTTSVSQNTIDESPFVYKPIEEIIKYIDDTVDIVDVIEPVYNFKNDGR
ncbi:MAG: RtcB family protein [Dehalococcoidales bacterium]|jgi:RNA-splicing ligase RtcB